MPQTPPCVACGEPLEGWEGHSCYKCVQGLAEQRDDLFDEVMKLRYENKILKEGLPIEEAKDGKDYLLVIKSGDEIIRVAGHYRGETTVDCNPPFTLGPRWETDLNYRFYFYEEDKEETELLGVYPLPSETKEGS